MYNPPESSGGPAFASFLKGRGDQGQPDVRGWARELGKSASERIVDHFAETTYRGDAPFAVVDLFSGCGGLSAGFDFLGRQVPSFELAAAADIDAHSVATYARNLGRQPMLADLGDKTRSKAAVREFVDALDLPQKPLVLVGGPPCQGFSAHRKKSGSPADARNSLLRSFADLAVEMQPEFIAFENVPEVTAKRYWHQFSEMRSILEEAGYLVRVDVHNLAEFGVPQARFRALVLACKKPFAPIDPYFKPDEFRTVRSAIGNLPPVLPGAVPEADAMHYCTRHRPSTIATIESVQIDGGSRPAGVGPKCLDKVDGFRDVYGRLFWDKPSNTITAYARNPASGRFVHPEQHRGLTIREAGLLQGFPKDFVFEGPFDDRFSQIGNAVPPIFSAALAAHILGELSSSTPPVRTPSSQGILEPTSNSFSSGIAGRKKRPAGEFA